jgi:hypothetical protein
VTRADRLTLRRIRYAHETLRAAFHEALQGEMGVPDGFGGAIESDASGAFSEAMRNLVALVGWKYGDEAWQKALEWE